MTESQTPVSVTAHDLHGPGAVLCPNPKMPLWSNHPKVYLYVGPSGQAKCPYCGTQYVLAPGAKVPGH